MTLTYEFIKMYVILITNYIIFCQQPLDLMTILLYCRYEKNVLYPQKNSIIFYQKII